MKKILLKSVLISAGIYLLLLVVLYFFQEKFIFFPQKLDRNHRYVFSGSFEEKSFRMADGVRLNGVLFKTDSSRGLIFYLHGNAGSLQSWGETAGLYTGYGYDVFMMDYRGYGKSEGSINSEKQFHSDVQAVYDSLKKSYREEDITILGYSIGTGPAAKLASSGHAKRLILQAPYYSLADMIKRACPVIPAGMLKYTFRTNRYLQQCALPVTIFHGDADEVIPYRSSVRLRALFKAGDTLIRLNGQGHNRMSDNPQYAAAVRGLLNR